MRRIATAVAALALVAGAAHAQGQGKGHDNKSGGPPAAAQHGGGGGNGGGNGAGHADRGNGGGMAMSAERGNQASHGNGNGNGQGSAMREQRPVAVNADRGNGNGKASKAPATREVHGNGNGNRTVVVDRNDRNDRVVVAERGDRRGPDRAFLRAGDRIVDGCPPGLAKKNPPCVPPGQVRTTSRLFAFDRPSWWGLTGLDDGRYRYDDGFLVRLGPDGRIGGYVPLLGGALSIGNAWPSYYAPVAMPQYYSDYYGLGPLDSYRYANDVIYRVDPQTAAITSIAALLTGDDFTIGQPMPLGYDVYNVPYDYRDRYYDTPDSLYRYNDGYIYQVDPKTRLIAAAIELLAS